MLIILDFFYRFSEVASCTLQVAVTLYSKLWVVYINIIMINTSSTLYGNFLLCYTRYDEKCSMQ